jgi:Fe-S oxidoreductase
MVIFVLLTAGAVFLAGREFRKKYRMIALGKPVQRFDKPQKRLLFAFKRVLLQYCAIENRPVVGFFHAMIFWGFLVFALVTLNHIFEGFFSGASLYGHGLILNIILLGANLFAAAILVAVVFFLVRRYIVKASTLERPSLESLTILSFITVLMISFVVYEAMKMANGAEQLSGNFLGLWLYRTGLTAPVSPVWISAMWWLHIGVVLAFLVFIPRSKHLHLVAGPVNLALRHDGPLAEIPVVNLEEQEQFGTPKITDLTKKDLLDLFSCAECGRCDDICPAYQSGKKLSPKTLLNHLKDNLYASADALAKGETDLKTLFADVVSEEELWACTTCGGCMTVCPMFNEHIPKIIGMRQYGVLMESKFPDELNALYRGLENQFNPWGINNDSRADWAKDLDVPVMAEKGSADVLFWVGCEGSFDSHNQQNSVRMAAIMKKAGVDFAILGAEEQCCGDPARRSGHEYLYQMLATANIETLKRYSFKKIVTFCPHGYHMLKNEYSRLGGEFEVVHASRFILELIETGKLTLKGQDIGKAAFHDPCYLGRYNDEYAAPRSVMAQACSSPCVELDRHHKHSFCCGAGGGGMWKEEHGGERISHVRLKEAAQAGVETLVTACPYCAVMFKDAIGETGLDKIKTQDLVELVYRAL